MKESAEHQVKNEQAPRVRCPKHTKMPKSVKTFGALGPWKTKEERNHYQRSMAIAIYEFEHRAKKVYGAKNTDAPTRGINTDVE